MGGDNAQGAHPFGMSGMPPTTNNAPGGMMDCTDDIVPGPMDCPDPNPGAKLGTDMNLAAVAPVRAKYPQMGHDSLTGSDAEVLV